jgi:hypothetical protein
MPTLSFFIPPNSGTPEEIKVMEEFLHDMQQQLIIQEQEKLSKSLEKNRAAIGKLIKSHPDKSHGFYLSDDLQGYAILDNRVESYCMIGQTFHVRPLLEEVVSNPEFILINVSLYDIKIFRGDFQHLEVIQHYEFDQLAPGISQRAGFYTPQYLGLIPYKTILAMKTIAQKVQEITLYNSVPVIVTGLEEIKSIFLRYFNHSVGVITHFQEDFYEKTCVQIQERCKAFRFAVMDYYSLKLKENIKRFVKSKRVLTDLTEIVKATTSGSVIQLIIPTEKKLWGTLNIETGEYELHKKMTKKYGSVDILNELAEEVIRQGGKIHILGSHFFPTDAHVMAIMKG